ncbi:MAG TPA: pseudouridine-5'-phosphate glycosidase [Candidatus Limnocylindria bacterium]|nr:pseudouridine-5'-phosphate glycosidase [Candidatus Limnocylindria bacterium]
MRLSVAPEIAGALARRAPVVALESTLIAHGLPRPANLETALALEGEVRSAGAVPATLCVDAGCAVVGADAALLGRLATETGVAKVSLRDLAPVLAAGTLGATTVAASVEIAARAGIAVFATGGIGGVHRGAERSFDESADLAAIAAHPVVVVCAGAKLVLDLALTLERLETLGVPVVGWQTGELPAFYVRSSGLGLAHRVDDADAAARVAREQLARGAGLVLAVPIPAADAIDRDAAEHEVALALGRAAAAGVSGSALTPYLLGDLGEATAGRTLRANVALLRNNARVAAMVAAALARLSA